MRIVEYAPTAAATGAPLLPGPASWPDLAQRVPLLSAREKEVFLLLGAGASNRTIAGVLGLAERTVKAHVAQIMAKVVVESRLQAGLVSLMVQLNYPHALSGTSGGVRLPTFVSARG